MKYSFFFFKTQRAPDIIFRCSLSLHTYFCKSSILIIFVPISLKYKQLIYSYVPNVSANRISYHPIKQKNGIFFGVVHKYIFCFCATCHLNVQLLYGRKYRRKIFSKNFRIRILYKTCNPFFRACNLVFSKYVFTLYLF